MDILFFSLSIPSADLYPFKDRSYYMDVYHSRIDPDVEKDIAPLST